MASDDELLDRIRGALTDDAPTEPRAQDVLRIRALAAARRADQLSSAAEPPPPAAALRAVLPRGSRRILQTVAIAASLGVGFLVGGEVSPLIGGGTTAGVVEFKQSLAATDGSRVEAEGRLTGIGRIVDLSSSDLPILATGTFYEVWFVGPGDTPKTPNRISAGTFHPDQNGRTKVSLTAAVDPRRYPTLVITAEPGDGIPDPSATEVLRGRLTIID